MQQAASFLFFTLHRVKMSEVTCELIIFIKQMPVKNANMVCFKDLNRSLVFLNAKKNLAHRLLLLRHSTYHDDLIKAFYSCTV